MNFFVQSERLIHNKSMSFNGIYSLEHNQEDPGHGEEGGWWRMGGRKSNYGNTMDKHGRRNFGDSQSSDTNQGVNLGLVSILKVSEKESQLFLWFLGRST